MAGKILILGESGTGKSTSIKTLDHETTFIIRLVNKGLPFRGWKKKYNSENKNIMTIDNSSKIESCIERISLNAHHIDTIIIDDLQYLMSIEFMDRVFEEGWDKYSEIAKHMFDLLRRIEHLRENLNVILMCHLENGRFGEKMKTIGNLLDDKITPEGLFEIVLKANTENGEYFFETQNNGSNTIKSPDGMFNKREPNDLKIILEKKMKYESDDADVIVEEPKQEEAQQQTLDTSNEFNEFLNLP